MATQHAPRVLVDREHRTMGRIEQDDVRRLPPDARHPEQVLSKGRERRPPHAVEAPPEALAQPASEGAHRAGRYPGRPGRLHGVGDVARGGRGQLGRIQQTAGAQFANGACRVWPGREPDEDGPDRDLERRPVEPPVLSPEAPLESDVEPEQPRLGVISRRPGNPPPSREKRTP
jgi:hypothetical protein